MTAVGARGHTNLRLQHVVVIGNPLKLAVIDAGSRPIIG